MKSTAYGYYYKVSLFCLDCCVQVHLGRLEGAVRNPLCRQRAVTLCAVGGATIRREFNARNNVSASSTGAVLFDARSAIVGRTYIRVRQPASTLVLQMMYRLQRRIE